MIEDACKKHLREGGMKSTEATFHAGVAAGQRALGVDPRGSFLVVVSNTFGGSYREVLHARFATKVQAMRVFMAQLERYSHDKHDIVLSELRGRRRVTIGKWTGAVTVKAVNREMDHGH